MARTDGSILQRAIEAAAPRASSLLCAPRSRTQERVETARDTHDSNLRQLCEGVRPQVITWAYKALPAGLLSRDPQARSAGEELKAPSRSARQAHSENKAKARARSGSRPQAAPPLGQQD